jgi:hypothetical protein
MDANTVHSNFATILCRAQASTFSYGKRYIASPLVPLVTSTHHVKIPEKKWGSRMALTGVPQPFQNYAEDELARA